MVMHKKAATGYLPPGSVVAERIEAAYPEMSQALQTFADFVLSEPIRIAHMSINETVQATGVSVATANRFARKLGFEGYAQFRGEVIRGFESIFEPVERLRTTLSKGSSVQDAVLASLEEDLRNLSETMQGLDAARIEQAVNMILAARNIFFIAFDAAAALANVMSHRLELAGHYARTIDNGGGMLSASRALSHYDENDLVIAIAFPRYMRETVELATAAHRRSIPVLSITDNQTSPLARLGTLTLYVRARRTYSSTSDTAILAMLEALAAGVAAKTPGAADAAQKFADFAYPWLITPEGR